MYCDHTNLLFLVLWPYKSYSVWPVPQESVHRPNILFHSRNGCWCPKPFYRRWRKVHTHWAWVSMHCKHVVSAEWKSYLKHTALKDKTFISFQFTLFDQNIELIVGWLCPVWQCFGLYDFALCDCLGLCDWALPCVTVPWLLCLVWPYVVCDCSLCYFASHPLHFQRHVRETCEKIGSFLHKVCEADIDESKSARYQHRKVWQCILRLCKGFMIDISSGWTNNP